jgi:hypothetical protein
VEDMKEYPLILFSLSENPLVLFPLSIVLCFKGIFSAPILGTLISKARDVLIEYEGQLDAKEYAMPREERRVMLMAITDPASPENLDPTPNRVHGKRPCLNRGIKNAWRPRRAWRHSHRAGTPKESSI